MSSDTDANTASQRDESASDGPAVCERKGTRASSAVLEVKSQPESSTLFMTTRSRARSSKPSEQTASAGAQLALQSFMVVNLADDDSVATRPIGLVRLVAGDVQLDPPRDPDRLLTVEIWEPTDYLDLFGSYRAVVPAEQIQLVQGAVLYFDVQLTSKACLPRDIRTGVLTNKSLKQRVMAYHDLVEAALWE